MAAPSLSVVIPTYRRGVLLLETLGHLLAQDPPPEELLVMDQTEAPDPAAEPGLSRLAAEGRIRRLLLPAPSIPRALNAGLREARGDLALFLDDDIVPAPGLFAAHRQCHAAHPDAWAVAGRVLSGEDAVRPRAPGRPARGRLRRDLDFAFDGGEPAWVENVMAGNLSVRRERALSLGGFDERFLPPVSFRFETEFARRLVAAGGRIRFEPAACIRHLRAGRGGTRSLGSHLASASPLHGAGDYYYALRCGRGADRARYLLRRPFREVCTRFHLRRPWWIPVKLSGELRAFRLALRLHRAAPDPGPPAGGAP